jgi:probable rRNA maturation factor
MYRITVQCRVPKDTVPAQALLKKWAREALKKQSAAELNIRIVNVIEITELNVRYRYKQGATNVLSFPFDMPVEASDEIPMLGDIVICADIVKLEAAAQGKPEEAHWAHMVVHGTLHLLGYDHEREEDAIIMESLEINILAKLGFKNPYQLSEKGTQ